MPRPPNGGPIVTEASVYQALSGGGVQRIGIRKAWPSWPADYARQFLAEWDQDPVLLCKDGRIAVVPRKSETGKAKVIFEVGPVKTFENFVVALPAGVDVTRYNSVVVWCESFGEFITAARYL